LSIQPADSTKPRAGVSPVVPAGAKPRRLILRQPVSFYSQKGSARRLWARFIPPKRGHGQKNLQADAGTAGESAARRNRSEHPPWAIDVTRKSC